MTASPTGVRVRLAPSPTGFMHVGTARTALFNWLYARHCGGAFVLRVEDTDRNRFVPSALEDLLDGLRWLGLEPDEGPGIGGAYGPYLQSERLPLYRAAADRLLGAGRAYRCFCSPDRLERTRAERAAAGLKVGYDRHCRSQGAERAAERAAAGEPCVVRLAMPLDGTLTLRDQIRGDIAFDAAEMEDVVLLKGDGYPTYHLAVVVDDHEMAISHVLRADEWIPSSPVQLWLYASFGWPEPVWAHLPLVLNPGGQGKLSKRRRAADPIGSGAGGSAGTDHAGSDAEPEPPLTQVREYRAAGYLPEAMVNFLALLGWAYSGEDEIFDLAAAADRFDLEAVRPAPSEWDVAKLRWMNGVYVRALGPDDLAERMLPYLTGAGLAATIDQVRRMAPLVRERLETLADCVHWLAFFWAEDVSPDLDDLVPKKLDAPGAISVLAAAEEALGSIPEWSVAAIEIALRDLANRMGLAPAQAFGPVRVAVSGQRVSPPLFDTLEIVGRQVTLRRLASARERLTARGR